MNHDYAAPESSTDGRFRLRIVDRAPPPSTGSGTTGWTRARYLVVALAAAAGALFAGSFFVPWWKFWLYAPQYPKGLKLSISLTGMGGDVHEIDILNHYIGMKHLADAAPLERELAGYGVALIAVLTLALAAGSGRKLNWLIALPAISFPVVFIADSFYWLYTFGHELDPRAPLTISPFTPQMFGNGQIGQFETFAQPAVGFWIAVAGVACAVAASVLRAKVCGSCSRAGTCKLACPRAMLLPDRGAPRSAEEAHS